MPMPGLICLHISTINCDLRRFGMAAVLYSHEEFELSFFESSGEVFDTHESHSGGVSGTVDTVEVVVRALVIGKHQLSARELKARLVI